ncbi:caspase (peptidase), partial [Bradyrhizobium guangdongense]
SNECEKIQDKKPVATREDAKPRDDERKKSDVAPAKPQATGQVFCNSAGCRPVRQGCRLENLSGQGYARSGGGTSVVENCN